VEYRNANNGDVKTFITADPPSDAGKTAPKFEMQCVDCHNRPTHVFDSPEHALDKALASGEIPVTLPFIKKKSVELLKANYATTQDATEKLPAELVRFYEQNYPEVYGKRRDEIHQGAVVVLGIYQRNVFPELKVSWGTYPNNLGHMDFPGCFRCHDGGHVGADGSAITQDCSSCHQALATDETSPQILKTLGIAERITALEKQ
jgi:hypothetical protein